MPSCATHHRTNPFLEKVWELIHINLGEALTLRAVSEQMQDPSLRETVARIATDRAVQARELQQHLRCRAEATEPQGQFVAACRQSWRQLRTALDKGDLDSVLRQARRSENHLKSCYQQVIRDADEGHRLQALLLRQYRKVVDQHDQLYDLCDAVRPRNLQIGNAAILENENGARPHRLAIA